MTPVRKAVLVLGLAAVLVSLAHVGIASAAFGLRDLEVAPTKDEVGTAATEAGSHPFALVTTLDVNTEIDPEKGELPEGAVRNIRVELPPGFVGNPTAVRPCSEVDFLIIDTEHQGSNCPDGSAVGFVVARVGYTGPENFTFPVYNLVPSPGVAAKIGFVALGVPVTIDLGVNPDPPYNVVATVSNISQAARLYGSTLTVWGNPAAESHDADRGRCVGPGPATCPAASPERPFLTLPRSCTGPLVSNFEADPWNPLEAPFQMRVPSLYGMSGCETLLFRPHVKARPTSRDTESPTGLDFNLDVDDEGLTSSTGTAQSDIKKAVVTLPEGVTVNPSVAEGLAVCGEAQFNSESVDSEPGQGCPQASKVGDVEVETPLLEGKLLRGEVFVASEYENPFHSMLALYMVIKDPALGILVKLPGRVAPDERTGQLVTTFGEPPYEIPQFPFSHFRFHFREGARAPLVTPPACGEFQVATDLTPWSGGPTLRTAAPFTIDHGIGGGPCPAGPAPFHPGFNAGTLNNDAGSYSPFLMRLTRQDGEQDLTRFSTILPPGVTGKIAGIPDCPDAGIARARSRQGARGGEEERDDPSCPAASQIGTTLGGAGVGSQLTYVPGKLYLAGPFNGDPLSVVAITPAVAGPFDAGTVVVREALNLNPLTAEVEVDGAASEPIPHILKGIPLDLRDLRVDVDRPGFTLNPTSCEEGQTRATLFGGGTALAPLTDQPVDLRARFQAASCASLPFKPKLKIRLEGATKRIGHPALKAVVTYPKKGTYANIGRAQVNLPHGEFLDQGNLNKTCTRPVLLAGNCPKSSVYGHAKAWTPLLAEPLQGPVYLVGGFGYKLPALVAELNGQFRILLVGKVDSGKNKGIRSTFEMVPDAPVSRFVLAMKGGKKYGLLENSENLCKAPKARRRAIARFTGQNGKVDQFKPVVRNDCGKKKGGGAKKHKSKKHK